MFPPVPLAVKGPVSVSTQLFSMFAGHENCNAMLTGSAALQSAFLSDTSDCRASTPFRAIGLMRGYGPAPYFGTSAHRLGE